MVSGRDFSLNGNFDFSAGRLSILRRQIFTFHRKAVYFKTEFKVRHKTPVLPAQEGELPSCGKRTALLAQGSILINLPEGCY